MGHVNEDNLDLMLAGLKLEKYTQLLNKKAIKFDTFVNMTKEDMAIVGIRSKKDQALLLETLRPLLHLYKDVNELPPIRDDLIIGNEVNQLRNLLGHLIVLRRTLLKQNRPKNILIDTTNSAASAIVKLADCALDSVSLIQSDMKQILRNIEGEKKKSRYLALATLGTAAIVITTYVIMNRQSLQFSL
ncbi:uncharacterized protein LOC106665984 [Cimex lectularius]|uniref:SAM domain-containing protein n=1 Tax=Cimex lectularius TaxID=79782 RepID=A0A8I6RN68_CIMLE|nr:uncharacterized protein LOC106665984 [Cimex lectularius]